MQKYQVNNISIDILLSNIRSEEIVIPEIQRPFVWEKSKVRDLFDSLYKGFPVGYIITWKNPNIKLKSGGQSEWKKILIDGQQRITALTAGILGQEVIDSKYKKIRIKIAFHPESETFEVQNSAILKDKTWIKDVSEVLQIGSTNKVLKKFLQENPDVNEDLVEKSIERLFDIPKKQIGIIELSQELDIDTVTEIFIRINSAGVVLSQADFAMSKISSDQKYGWNEIRKAIDYFCHLALSPEFYRNILENDVDFVNTKFFEKISWLKNENDGLYDPNYSDVLRVAFTSMFKRWKLQDLVSLLSGRNFETRVFEERIMEESFQKLEQWVLNFINETRFKRFLMIVRSAWFVDKSLIRSTNVLNFAYILYQVLVEKKINSNLIEKYVRRWLVLSILTWRYSSSPESQFDHDIKQIYSQDFGEFLQSIEEGELSDAFWDNVLPLKLQSSVASSPFFHIFLAAQSYKKSRGFLWKDILVADLLTHQWDVHHIFPKNFLIKKWNKTRGEYNQIANYVYMQREINIRIGDKSPEDYFSKIISDISEWKTDLSGIMSMEDLKKNLQENCVPLSVFMGTIENYEEFLEERRGLMVQCIKEYYFSL